jgi:hypothetical protein
MPKCSICGKDKSPIYTCKECGCKYCKDDGDAKTERCSDCFDYDLDIGKQAESDMIKDLQNIEQEDIEIEGD